MGEGLEMGGELRSELYKNFKSNISLKLEPIWKIGRHEWIQHARIRFTQLAQCYYEKEKKYEKPNKFKYLIKFTVQPQLSL